MKSMIAVVLIGFIGVGTAGAGAWDDALVTWFFWSKLKEEGKLSVGEVVPPYGDKEQLKLSNSSNQPRIFQILSIPGEKIIKTALVLRGPLRPEKVQGIGYIWMQATYPDGRKYSVMATRGWQAYFFKETGEPKRFYIEFFCPSNRRPKTLDVFLSLPGPGTVYLSPLQLVNYDKEKVERRVKPARTWNSLRMYGFLFAGLVGIFLFSAYLLSRNQARIVVHILLGVLFIVGIGFAGYGTLGFIRTHDFWLAGPPILLGGIQVVVSAILFMVARRYLRKRA